MVYGLENCVNEAKSQYQESLRNLEKISNEIHAQRNQGQLPCESDERRFGVNEEQLTYTEFVSYLFRCYYQTFNFYLILLRTNYLHLQLKPVRQYHHRTHISGYHRQRAARRLSWRNGPGDPPCHQ